MNENGGNCNFSDADIEALIDAFINRVKREIGSSVLDAVKSWFIAAIIGLVAIGLAVKFKSIHFGP